MYIAIYSVILQILHIIYDFLLKLYKLHLYLIKFIRSDNHAVLYSKIKSLKKIPRHMVIILGSEDPSYNDLSNIVFWSIIAGIPIISFYDYKGTLKRSKDKLLVKLNERNIKYENNSVKKYQNGYKNGIRSPIRINFFSVEDGQNSLVEVTKHCVSNNVDINSIEIDYIDEQMKRQIGGYPDPELALYCGPVCTTYGLLPWQIRLTEFVDIQSHHGLYLSEFYLALKRYEKSEQRFGK